MFFEYERENNSGTSKYNIAKLLDPIPTHYNLRLHHLVRISLDKSLVEVFWIYPSQYPWNMSLWQFVSNYFHEGIIFLKSLTLNMRLLLKP